MASNPVSFEPVPVRARSAGWGPEKQAAFLEALAATACVVEACKRVGMSRSSAYDLRARVDAASFRAGWDAALDHAVQCVEDGAISRALNGVSRPVFYKGEQIGERRYFDERLTMFILRYRAPQRYGKWRDRTSIHIPEDGTAQYMWHQFGRVEQDAQDDIRGIARKVPPPVTSIRVVSEASHEG